VSEIESLVKRAKKYLKSAEILIFFEDRNQLEVIPK
jgi:hypothetical protein